MPKKVTGETLFRLVYGSEAVFPIEIAVTSHRFKHLEATKNDDQRCLELDLVDEKRRVSEQTQGKMRLATAQYYNRRVSSRQLFMGEKVWRRNEFGIIRSSLFPISTRMFQKTNKEKNWKCDKQSKCHYLKVWIDLYVSHKVHALPNKLIKHSQKMRWDRGTQNEKQSLYRNALHWNSTKSQQG